MELKFGKITVSAGFFLFVTFLYFFYDGTFVLSVLLSLFVHEIGHIGVMKLFGVKWHKLTLNMTGANINYKIHLTGYVYDILVAAAGPAASLLLSFLAGVIGRFFLWETCIILSGINLLFCIFNLLPVGPLDGGKILYAALSKKLDAAKIWKIQFLTGICISGCLMICAIAAIICANGTGLLLPAAVLFILCCKLK